MSGFVYVIAIENGPVKVGVAIDVKKRLSGLQTSIPVRLTLHKAFALDAPYRVERRAHAILRPYRTRGEWFHVPPNVAVEAVEAAILHAYDRPCAPIPIVKPFEAELPFPWTPAIEAKADTVVADFHEEAAAELEPEPEIEPEPEEVFPVAEDGRHRIGFIHKTMMSASAVRTLRLNCVDPLDIFSGVRAVSMDLRKGDVLVAMAPKGVLRLLHRQAEKKSATLRVAI